MYLKEEKKSVLKWIGAFFAVMVLFTLLSRAVYQHGTAVVRTQMPTGGTIDHTVQITGKTVQNQEVAVTTMGGLRVGRVCVNEGQQVKQGDVLFVLDLNYLDEIILKQEQDLKKQQLSVQDAWTQNSNAQKQKENQQAQAEENYDNAVAQAQTAVDRAQRDLDRAKTALENYRNGVSDEEAEKEALLLACQAAKGDYERAVAALEALEREMDQAVQDAISQAEMALQNASAQTETQPEETVAPVEPILVDIPTPISSELTREEKDGIEEAVRAGYADRLSSAQSALQTAQQAFDDVNTQLEAFHQRQNSGSEVSEQDLIDAVDRAQEAYDDAEASLESTKTTYGRAVSSANLPAGTSNSAQIGQITYDQMKQELEETFGNTPKIVFWENVDGYLFFTTHTGLYSYIPGGSVTEELVSGSRSSLGDPTCIPIALTGRDDGSFYLLCDLDGESTLCYFTYDTEVPAVADTKLNIYSLYADDDLNQMISQFQKANLDITVELEIGLSGEDGMTEADAIRTLNTEILAGNGPDLICLDGFNLESYLEKGVLADVSHILDQADPLLRNITDCYAENGKICAVPTTFTFPAMYGKEEFVSRIHDLSSLVEVATEAKATIAPESRVVQGMYPDIMADDYYDSCSAAWMQSDGTLDKEKLTEFYAAMKELYALDEPFRQANPEWMAEVRAEYVNGEGWAIPGQYTGLSGVTSVHGELAYLPAGTLDGMYRYAHVLAGEEEYLGDGYITRPLDGQAKNVFLPRRIMGILTEAEHTQAAEKFLSFMLSDEVQAKDLTSGFPVNQVTFDRELSEDRYVDSVISDYPNSYHAQWPDAARREELRIWVEKLSTPANTNRTIRYMVMEPMYDCCTGAITPEQAAEKALQSLNLYLSE